ncbi:hypothetical protein HY642_00545 [Candidatus Woesearchaeota archaeon]|nr:hypothetical protein [Candidatus Woesearchaeota archaeon]
MRAKNSKFFKAYFVLMVLWAVIGLIDSFFTGSKTTVGQVSTVYALFIGLFEFAVLALSVVAIYLFIKNKFSKLALALPIYHVATAILLVVYGFIWGVTSAVQGNPITDMSITPGLIAYGVISSLFELVFSSYILYRFR